MKFSGKMELKMTNESGKKQSFPLASDYIF